MAAFLTTLARANGAATDRESSRRLDLVRQLSEEFRARNDIYDAIDKVVYMQNQVKIPARWENFALEVKAPLALRVVNTITAALSVNAPVTHFEPVRMGTAGEANATAREHFFDAAWMRQEDEADRQLFRIWMHHLVTHGSAWFKTVECSKTAWAQYYESSSKLAAELDEGGYGEDERRKRYDGGTEELKRKAAYPIMTTVPPPSNMVYIPTERGFSFVAEVSDVPYYEALTRFGASLGRGGRIVPEAEGLPQDEWPRGMSGTRTIRKIEVWEWDRCFPAETKIAVDSAPKAISRRWYVGELVKIATAGGHELSGTPNHPVLTDRGWIPLGELVEGDRVIRRTAPQRNARAGPHDQDEDAAIGEVFDSAAKARRPERHMGTVHDFHGDGQDSQVEVVALDGQLQYRHEATFAQPVGKDGLAASHKGLRLLLPPRRVPHLEQLDLMGRDRRHDRAASETGRTLLLAGSTAPAQRGGGLSVAQGNVCTLEAATNQRQRATELRRDGGNALLELDVAPHDLGGRNRVVPFDRDASSDRNFADEPLTASVPLSDSALRLSEFNVVPDDVVSIEREAFSGYVYNLETRSHYYSANQIIAHNCHYYLCDPGGSMGTARLVKSVRHGYGNPLTHTLRGPYFFANGITTSSNDHRYAGLSVIFGFLYLYPLFDSMLTGLGQGGFQWAYPFLGSDTPPAFPQQQQLGLTPLVAPDGQPIRSTLQLQPGDVLPNGLHFVDPPRLGMDMRAFMEQVKALLELAMPSVMTGLTSPDTSGYALNQTAYLAGLSFDPIVKQAERALSRRTGFESWLIERRISERVWAWGDLPQTPGIRTTGRAGFVSIAPEDLAGTHVYDVRLEPELPSSRVTDIRMHSEMVSQRFESVNDAIEALGGSPSEVEMSLLLQDVKADPRAKGKILDRTFALIAIREQQERAAAQADILAALGAGVPPPGAALGGEGQVFQPGQTLPLTPTPAGAGAGAPGGVGGGRATTLGPGPTAGLPSTPGNYVPLPGQGG